MSSVPRNSLVLDISVQNNQDLDVARPREFQREEALDKAMEVFWTQGYEATSMTELHTAMGIGRQSLYDTFGDKRDLFTEALGRYLGGLRGLLGGLSDADDGFRAVRAYFDATVQRLTSSTPRRACLMFNTCMELAPHDTDIQKQVGRGVRDLRGALKAALTRAQAQGNLAADANVERLAMFLTTQLGGMAVMAKGGFSKKELQAAADLALEAVQ